MSKKTLRIANAGGFWGDDPGALKRQILGGPLDYITMDFLAEVTMSILKKQELRQKDLGYAKDILPMLAENLKDLLAKKICLITNAGGTNPRSCAKAIQKMAASQGLSPKIAVVDGDDILTSVADLQEKQVDFKNIETEENLSSEVFKNLSAANVYLGARPVVMALEKFSPDLIITGRVTDTGITLAPMIHHFKWAWDDWDKLASGIVAGHLLECGSQVTGGNFTDWHKVKDFKDMGFPIVELREDASFSLSKHPETGGLVSVDTVREQLVYEMGDPKSYISPDVVCDFSSVKLKEGDEKESVEVFGVKGFPPTSSYKVSMAYQAGYKVTGQLLISGPQALKKARAFSEIFWQRTPKNLSQTESEFLGWNSCHRSLSNSEEPSEIVLQLSAKSLVKKELALFKRLISSLILSGPPGVCVLGGGARQQEIMSYWPALIPKELISPNISLYQNGEELSSFRLEAELLEDYPLKTSKDIQRVSQESISLDELLASLNKNKGRYLSEICLARSGDKGDSCNIGVLARSKQSYQFLDKYLTAQRVKNIFQELCQGTVTRYNLPGLLGFNFILEQSLGGGGSSTLRADAQGKTFSQALLRQKVSLPDSLVETDLL